MIEIANDPFGGDIGSVEWSSRRGYGVLVGNHNGGVAFGESSAAAGV